ncbi:MULTISPECIES: MFS transporter [Paenibacillus]|jgi:PPP family 3-phenylpropionic acid transporter|uniref:MFS transporter, PPP family, 3-phenylpropionic acid transporter n=1 Tax=Paenibacillus barengoltzii J12 TaxID=935846 RepID=A0ABY1LS95_9BACL|nr:MULTISPECIES: MFS transporter [Paenibacillus]MDU0328648.1 MFS transporter [Paenibacillus sp. 3LSP]MEC2346295.1 MFS transporter [Paenibacillus barengoltzii]SME94009.1 MFS transporter, PPP family, 3-phenylpropionic acid transporter [Paenibacillus barengoltzii J12]
MARLQDKRPYSSFSLLPLGLLNFLIYGTLVIFTAFFQLYLQDIGMDKLEIGSLMAVGPLISLVAHPFWKSLGDQRQNPRAILLVMMLGLLIMGHLVFKVTTFSMLYVTMILLYFFLSPLLSQNNTLTLGYLAETPDQFRTYRIWGSLGWTFIALAAGPIIDAVGHEGSSLLFSVTLMLAIGATLLLPTIRQASQTPWLKGRELRLALKNKYLVVFVLFSLLVAIPNAINTIFMPLFMIDLGGTRLSVGGAVFLSTVFEYLAFILLDRLFKRKLSYLLACTTIVSLLFAIRWDLMSEATLPVHIMLIQLLHSVTFGGFFYVGTKLIALLLPRPLRSAGQAVYTFAASGLASAIAGFWGGWMFQNFGPVVMYRSGVALTLIGALGFAAMWYQIRHHGYSPAMDDQPDVP